MKVLVLTTEKHVRFIQEVAWTNEILENHEVFVSTQPYVFIGNYDIGISFMNLHKVPAKEVNSHTWFNFHPGPLPEYKGRNLCYHAIMNGETEFGATVHYMDENFDTGDIIEVAKFRIPEWWTAEQLSNATIDMSKQLFKLYFPKIMAGYNFPHILNVGGTYYKKRVIVDTLVLSDDFPLSKFIRAVTYKEFVPRVIVGGNLYKIVRDE